MFPNTETFKQLYRPLEPIPTGETPDLPVLEGMRAVLFDLYGTLFISGSGDIDAARPEDCDSAFLAALDAVGIPWSGPPGSGTQRMLSRIEESHAEARQRGVEYPEVDIVDTWRKTFADLAGQGSIAPSHAIDTSLLQRFAVEYEARANPVWPMPGVTECLRQLRSLGLALGIVSNSQFFTRELFPILLGDRAEAWGFDPALQYYSYEHGVAKPGLELFQMARDTLRGRGLEPSAVLYVGNDILNDIRPAAQLGFRTALFAGDQRSLRRRQDDPRVDGLTPDVVLTKLADLRACFPR